MRLPAAGSPGSNNSGGGNGMLAGGPPGAPQNFNGTNMTEVIRAAQSDAQKRQGAAPLMQHKEFAYRGGDKSPDYPAKLRPQ